MSDPDEDLEEDDEDPEEDPADHPTDRDDDEDEEEEESSGDKADDKEDDEDEDKEEEHPAPTESIPSPPLPAYRVTARMSIRPQTPVPFLSKEEAERFLDIPTPLPSPLTPLSSPLPQIPSPPLLVSPPLPTSPTHPLGYRTAMIWLRAEAPSTSYSLPLLPPIILSHTRSDAPPLGTPPSGTPPLLPIPVPTSSPPLMLPSTDHRMARPEVSLPPQKRMCIALVASVSSADAKIVALTTEQPNHMASTTDRIVEALRLISTLQTQVTALQRQQGPARGPAQPDVSEEDAKMAPKRTTRANPANTTATTSVTNAQLKAMINQGVIDALAARDADRNTNGDDSHNSRTGVRRTERVARECTYPDFMKCQPLNFKGTEGVVELIQWFEKMETMFSISNCFVENQIKFSTCTLLAGALTWWKSHVRTVGHDVAMFPEESDKIERYVGGLLDMIHRSVVALKPKTMQEAIKIEIELMDKKIRTFAERQTKNKRKQDDNEQQQQQNKRQNTSLAYTAGSGEKKPYGGSKPLCPKCNYHHDGPCAPKCHKCNRVGHLARDCRSPTYTNASNNHRGTGAGQKPTCYKCGAHGHFKRDCPKLKNNNHGNQGGNGNALAKVYAVGRAGTNPESNVVT
ncbi:putative reverse transcriptase domain-containing protein, partial [Tanacetum coccineum]